MYYNVQKFTKNDSSNFSVPQLESMLTRKLTIRSAEHNVISIIYVKRETDSINITNSTDKTNSTNSNGTDSTYKTRKGRGLGWENWV